MCTSPRERSVLSSTPGMSSTPKAAAAAMASATPSVVSWSVRARAVTPAAWAARTTAAGDKVPSEALEWTCRSMDKGNPFLRSAGRLALLGEDILETLDVFGLQGLLRLHENAVQVAQHAHEDGPGLEGFQEMLPKRVPHGPHVADAVFPGQQPAPVKRVDPDGFFVIGVAHQEVARQSHALRSEERRVGKQRKTARCEDLYYE